MFFEIINLGDILLKIDVYPDGVLLIKGTYPFTRDSLCAIVPGLAETEEDEIRESELMQQGFEETLTTDDVSGIIYFKTQQNPQPTLDHLIEAFNFYFERDAFLLR